MGKMIGLYGPHQGFFGVVMTDDIRKKHCTAKIACFGVAPRPKGSYAETSYLCHSL
jgi:hypothetical protein